MQLSDTSKKYPSKYTNDLVTAANHITEILIERKAAKDGKILREYFWRDPVWKRLYQLTLLQVAKLLNVYSEAAVLNAVKREKWAYSVQPPGVKQAILEEEDKLRVAALKTEVSKQEIVVESDIVVENKSRPSFGKSKIGALK